jgi:hypothetical protein
MSSIPTLKRQVATSQDEYEHLFQKVVKYSRRLQNELNSWKNQQEASDVRQHMRSLFCEPSVEVMCRSIIAHLSPVDYEEEEEDLDIDQTNIITGKRKRNKPVYYVDDHFEELMFEDVPDEEMYAAIEEDISEEEEETDEEWTPDEQGTEDYDEY